jgi:type I restriction enzyme R subunit
MDSQRFAVNFSNNNLNGHTKFLDNYKSSKARVCVTVGMMTTGYDCQDILNIGLLRPIYSPTDFIQIKGRGTRKFTFNYKDDQGEDVRAEKETFKLFDFFAVCEYFEEKYDYDQIINLPPIGKEDTGGGGTGPGTNIDEYNSAIDDPLKNIKETAIGLAGLKPDWKLFEKASVIIMKDKDIKTAVDSGRWDDAVSIVRIKYENKPEEYISLENLRRSEKLDRRLTWKEVIERVFGFIPKFKAKDEMLEEECQKFIEIYQPDNQYIQPINNFMKAYITDPEIREIVEKKEFGRLATNSKVSINDYKALGEWKEKLPTYIKDYITINTYL